MEDEGMDNANHHLMQSKSGLWFLRVTVYRDIRLNGERVKVSLGTHDVEEARALRDLLLRGYEKAKIIMGTMAK